MTQEKLVCLFEEYKTKIYRFCIQLTKNRADADDLFQDTFLLAFQKHARIDENQNPKSYLFTVCLNLWKTESKKRKAVSYQNESERISSSVDLEANMILKERKQIITQAVSELKENQRLPMYLYYSADMSVSEIAKILKIPEGTVKSRMHKARAILRERLEKQYGRQ